MKPGEIRVETLPMASPNGACGHPDTTMPKAPGITDRQCSHSSYAEQAEMADCRGGFNLQLETTGRMQSQLQNLFHTLLHELMTAKSRVHELEISA